MGVDCSVHLPPETRARDVANAIGLLAGLSGTLEPLKPGGAVHLVVEGVSVEPSAVETCSDITVEGLGRFLFHHEFSTPEYSPEGGPAYVGILPRSTPVWCGIARGLVEFFGGVVDFQDCDDVDRDLEVDKPRDWNNPCDGEPWDAFQREIAAIQPAKPLPEVAAYRDP